MKRLLIFLFSLSLLVAGSNGYAWETGPYDTDTRPITHSLIPRDDGAIDLGSTTKKYRVVYTDSLVGAATVTGGTIDGTVIGGTTPAAGSFTTITIDSTTTADSYTTPISLTWTAGADMAAGGSNGIYSWAKINEDVQNAYGLRARMDLRGAAADVAVNQARAVDALINLNDTATVDFDVDDNISVYGASIHGGVANALMDGTGTGALGGATLNLYVGMWGPTAEQDYSLETNFIKMISHAGTTVDYGLNIESSSDMAAGILLNSHASNSPATMDAGVKMISAAGKMVYGIDMDEAGITTADIRGQNGEIIENITDGTWNFGAANLKTTGNITTRFSTIEKTTDATLTAAECSDTLITNRGWTGAADMTLTLPDADTSVGAGLKFKFMTVVTDAAEDIYIDTEGSTTNIYLNGTPIGDGERIWLDNPTIGESVICHTFTIDGTTYDWSCSSDVGDWMDKGN